MFFLSLISFFTNKLVNYTGRVSAFLLFPLIIIIFISVLLRYIFSIGFTWLQDLYVWIHASIILLSIAYTSKLDGHVRIDLLYRGMSKKLKYIVNLMGLILFSLPVSYLIMTKSYPYFLRSLIQNESSKETGGLPYIYVLKFLILLMGITMFVYSINEVLKYLERKNDRNH